MKKLNVKSIDNLLVGLFFASIPMMPIFTIYGFYALGFFVSFLFLLKIFTSKVNLKLNWFDVIYLLLIFWNIISLNWSITGEMYVIKYMIIYFIFSFCSIKLLLCNNNPEQSLKIFSKWFIGSSIIITLVCIFFEYKYLANGIRLGTYIFAEPYGTRMMYTYNLEIASFLMIYYIFQNPKLIKKLLILFLILIIGIILSGTRKIFVGIIIFILIYIFLKNKSNFFSLIFKFLFIFAFCIISLQIVLKVPLLYNSFGYRVESALNYINNNGEDGSMRDRNAMIKYGIQFWENNPIIGNGSNTFHYYFNIVYNQNLYAHNTYVELLCNLGIIGCFLYYLNYILYIFRRNNRIEKKYTYLFKASLIALMILDYWTISYYRIQFIIYFELIATIYSYKSLNSKENTK